MTKSYETALALKVPYSEGESIRRRLIEKGILRTQLKISKDKSFLYLPISFQPKEDASYPVVSMSFEVLEDPQRSYKELLDVPENLKALAPSSFDIIGSILLIKIPEELKDYRVEIGQALLTTHHHVETVCDVEPVSGEFRTRDITVIAGKSSYVTVHTEFGLQFEVDVKRTYFSPRLGGERRRIAELVKKDEVIVDMFTGVAPFPMMIARYSQPKMIYAIDKNDVAIRFARKNILRNKCEEVIEVIHKDAKQVDRIMSERNEKADRLIMNLPFLSFNFLPDAFHSCAHHSTIHYYEILSDEQLACRIEDIRTLTKEMGIILQSIDVHKIKTYAPREFYIALDITARNNHADVA